MTLLREQAMDDVLVVVGGIIPAVDRQPLKDLGRLPRFSGQALPQEKS